jgi:hypothetical protein
MIITTLCNSCYSRFDIVVDPDSGHLVAQLADEDGLANCPKLCGGKINLTMDKTITGIAHQQREQYHLTALELYRACHGAGLPDEVPKSGELVDSMLKAHKVKDALVEEHGGRIYLHELRLENGSVIHLTAGGRGAQVLKVTRAA